jgi:hypothetical protein
MAELKPALTITINPFSLNNAADINIPVIPDPVSIISAPVAIPVDVSIAAGAPPIGRSIVPIEIKIPAADIASRITVAVMKSTTSHP